MYISVTMQELQPVCPAFHHTLTTCLETKKSLRTSEASEQTFAQQDHVERVKSLRVHELSWPITTKVVIRRAQNSLWEFMHRAILWCADIRPVSAEFSSSSASPPVLVQEAAVRWDVIVAARFRGEHSVQRVMHQFWPPWIKHSAQLIWHEGIWGDQQSRWLLHLRTLVSAHTYSFAGKYPYAPNQTLSKGTEVHQWNSNPAGINTPQCSEAGEVVLNDVNSVGERKSAGCSNRVKWARAWGH